MVKSGLFSETPRMEGGRVILRKIKYDDVYRVMDGPERVLEKCGFEPVVRDSPEDRGYPDPTPSDKWIRTGFKEAV